MRVADSCPETGNTGSSYCCTREVFFGSCLVAMEVVYVENGRRGPTCRAIFTIDVPTGLRRLCFESTSANPHHAGFDSIVCYHPVFHYQRPYRRSWRNGWDDPLASWWAALPDTLWNRHGPTGCDVSTRRFTLFLDPQGFWWIHVLLRRLLCLGSLFAAYPCDCRPCSELPAGAESEMVNGTLVAGSGADGNCFVVLRHFVTAASHCTDYCQHGVLAHHGSRNPGVPLWRRVVDQPAPICNTLQPYRRLESFHRGEYPALRRDYPGLPRRQPAPEYGWRAHGLQ